MKIGPGTTDNFDSYQYLKVKDSLINLAYIV